MREVKGAVTIYTARPYTCNLNQGLISPYTNCLQIYKQNLWLVLKFRNSAIRFCYYININHECFLLHSIYKLSRNLLLSIESAHRSDRLSSARRKKKKLTPFTTNTALECSKVNNVHVFAIEYGLKWKGRNK